MESDDLNGPGNGQHEKRSRADGNPRPAGGDGPGQRPPWGLGSPPAASGIPMPDPVRKLRVLMMVLGGMQAVLGLALVSNSVEIATSIWGEGEPNPWGRTAGEAHSGEVVFAGILVLAIAAWGITTAVKFPTRNPALRTSAFAYGWTALPFTVVFFQVMPLLGIAWLVPAILALVRPNQPETRAWFGGSGALAR
ncbi:hypothetical protein [Streptomyces sp. Wh19]|uniref:hypothetical protein n=1 Tax=Streptomyces sp. Wh19 TaxID=3076629 RepID=UPI0029587468|nr:hypothetical protein [Streptomyces sp. Wh19]MDV9200241.1 hypothetical protein [Streptomyces sp. Wh19]